MSWIAISLRIKPEFADILGEALIARGSAGVWESEPGWITAYFPAASDPRAVKELLDGMAVSLGQGDCVISPVDDQDWIATWKASVTPLRVTPRLTIVPSWRGHAEAPGERVVILDPEMAFGTGHHETTRMCLEALDERLQRGDRPTVFDLGTGSGILAIAAAKLGAGRVTACDIDPLARETAIRNVAVNKASETVSVVAAGQSERLGRYDVVVANLTADDLITLMPEIAQRVGPVGEMILSGILQTRAADVAASLAAHGLGVAHRRTAGEWVALVVRADGSSS
ncbi:MAG: 50S ribosomal protein L11 methyltransferase [Nitrospirota bacterium]